MITYKQTENSVAHIHPRLRLLAPWLILAIGLAGQVFAQVENEITDVSPSSGEQGATSLSVSFTLDSDSPEPPPAGVLPDSVTIGSISGTSIDHPDPYTITALFDIPEGEALGAKDVAVLFNPPEGTLTFSLADGFTVSSAPDTPPEVTGQPQNQSVRPGATALFNVSATGTDPLTYEWQINQFPIPGATNAYLVLTDVDGSDEGAYRCRVMNVLGTATSETASLTVDTNAAQSASDSAVDPAYDAGWTNGSSGGSGFDAWQLSAPGQGGFFTGTSEANAGGSGGIDADTRSWGLWSTNSVAEATRTISSSALASGEVFTVNMDNGFIQNGASAGIGLQNAAGDTLWELYFSGGDAYYTVNDQAGPKRSPAAYTADGMQVEFEHLGGTSYLARVTDASGYVSRFKGYYSSQADPVIARFHCWNDQAGSGSDYDLFINNMSIRRGTLEEDSPLLSFPLVDTGQNTCFNNTGTMSVPGPGEAFAGQDAQYDGYSTRYTLNPDGLTVYDNVTGLTWKRTTDTDGDGDIDGYDKLSWSSMQSYPGTLNGVSYGGYDDWRLPSIKEMYSLMDFQGMDPSGYTGDDTSSLVPFIDQRVFDFDYGDTNLGERIIDSQYGTTSLYVSTTMDGDATLFGVNFADGRIKGYGLTIGGSDKTFFVMTCRGNPAYGSNNLEDNGDSTVTDHATGLTWQQNDSMAGMNWAQALAYAEGLTLGGYSDWRLPNAKELQSILDYTRSPDTSASAAIDPIFNSSAITNEEDVLDYPFYWTSTTHMNWSGSGAWGAYLCFGRALGYMESDWKDVHGAGSQRSDPKYDDGTDYSSGHGPQGDAVRIFNFVRCVRGGATSENTDTDGDGLTDWTEYNYATNITNLSADGDLDDDGYSNKDEENAGTSLIDNLSYLQIENTVLASNGTTIYWSSVADKSYTVERCTNLLDGIFEPIGDDRIQATAPMNALTDELMGPATAVYRITVN